MTVLVLGRSGQVARELAALPGMRCMGREAMDLRDPQACAAALRDIPCTAVINAAAWTAVDKAESEEAEAHLLNAEAPGVMARAAAELGLPFVQISTDYVFDGAGTEPHMPDDPVAPPNAYGRTKLAGEEAVAGAGGAHAILRTSWVFSAHGANFPRTMLRLGRERDRLTIVADQIGGPTFAGDIARACAAIAAQLQTRPEDSGIYHYSGAPDVSWAEFAREIFAQADISCAVEDIPTSAYPTPAVRPLNSRLDCSATKRIFGLDRPDWKAGLATMLQQIAEEESR
ncbi:dTDP-4-dehydrorhamnose reductase [Salipiger thiooxidans]|uniref:dTDP-4-dehydrorhamnose reductase n=2 Tax=Salipiger thiooxidans TaxID=282683 RepID=A0A1G7LNM4_9RHOB|nr:dTDP-4-dehydrorhamnose reductase [Salipiger thiooxidans]